MDKTKIITLLTDFGLQDVYVGIMKGVISQINPNASIIDLTHDIPPQDIAAGSCALLSAYKYFPINTVHLAVIDPGVGSSRRGVAIEFDGGFLVGADNGLFSNLLSQTPAKKVVSLDNPQYWRSQSSSSTFHGRDIFAPIAAHLASGIEIEKLGTEIELESLISSDFPLVKIEGDNSIGQVQYIDRFGNLITNIAASDVSEDQLSSSPQVINLQVIIHNQIIPMVATYSDRPRNELVALIGSHGYLEIAVNCGNAQARLQAQVGATVIVKSSIKF